MAGADALIPENPAELIDPLKATYDQAFEVELSGNTKR